MDRLTRYLNGDIKRKHSIDELSRIRTALVSLSAVGLALIETMWGDFSICYARVAWLTPEEKYLVAFGEWLSTSSPFTNEPISPETREEIFRLKLEQGIAR